MSDLPPRWGLTRVAFGCASLADIEDRIATLRLNGADHMAISSRRVPRRDLGGGAIFWIIRHTLVARQAIQGVDERMDADGALAIFRLAPRVAPIVPRPCRAHQGWRYLAAADWPADLDGEASPLPPALVSELGALSLL